MNGYIVVLQCTDTVQHSRVVLSQPCGSVILRIPRRSTQLCRLDMGGGVVWPVATGGSLRVPVLFALLMPEKDQRLKGVLESSLFADVRLVRVSQS